MGDDEETWLSLAHHSLARTSVSGYAQNDRAVARRAEAAAVDLGDPAWLASLPRFREVDVHGDAVVPRIREDRLRSMLANARGVGDTMATLAGGWAGKGMRGRNLLQFVGRAGATRLDFATPSIRGQYRALEGDLRIYAFERPIYVIRRQLSVEDHLMRYGTAGDRGELVRLNDSEFVRVEREDDHVAVVWSTDLPLSTLIGTLIERSQPNEDFSARIAVGEQARDVVLSTADFVANMQTWDDEAYYATVPFKDFDFAWRRTPATASRRGRRYGEAGIIYATDSPVVDYSYVETTGSPDVREYARKIIGASSIARLRVNKSAG